MVKVMAYVTGTQIHCKIWGLSFLFNFSGGHSHDYVGCQAEVHRTSKNTIFSNLKTRKTQKILIIRHIDWHEVGWPLSCNAVQAEFATLKVSVAVALLYNPVCNTIIPAEFYLVCSFVLCAFQCFFVTRAYLMLFSTGGQLNKHSFLATCRVYILYTELMFD